MNYKRYLCEDVQWPKRTKRRWAKIGQPGQFAYAASEHILVAQEALHGDDYEQHSDAGNNEYASDDHADDENEDNMENAETEYPDIINANPIYEGASLTRSQLLAMLVAYILRHKVSGSGLRDLLELLNIVVPGCVPKSKYYLEKTFFKMGGGAQVHYICPDCEAYAGMVPPQHCGECGEELDKENCYKQGKYFMVLPLEAQLKQLMETHKIQQQLRSHVQPHVDGYYDICSRQNYSGDRLRDFVANEDNISLSFSTDGVPIFKFSKFGIWPIFCTVNELPPKERRENILLHSLWFGPKKPRVDTFFAPFITELARLHHVGFQWTDEQRTAHCCKVAPVLCICDAVARSMVQNFSQFNGDQQYILHG